MLGFKLIHVSKGAPGLITPTHWGWCYIYVSLKWVIIGSGNGLAADWHQAIIWTISDLLSFGTLETNICEILVEIQTFLRKIMHLKMLFAKSVQYCQGLYMLIIHNIWQ